MGDPCRILTAPLRLTGPLSSTQRSLLVSADALRRRATAAGRPVELAVGVLSGSLAGQAALERELAREGHDRSSLGRDAFVARMRSHESELRTGAAEELRALQVEVDLEAGTIDSEAAVRAARTAFVRLYEAGLLEVVDRVVDVCPRCETAVEAADVEVGTADGERLVLRLGDLSVATTAPELLLGAVAVVVPPGGVPAPAAVQLPLAERTLPVLADADAVEPRLLVPAHDQADLELARRHGFPPVTVLDEEGVVRLPGPLEGLNRFAARVKAVELLVGQGVVDTSEEAVLPVGRCRRCGTVLVPLLGRHWFLRTEPLEIAAADLVRQGEASFTPPTARDDFLAAVGQRGGWCLSSQVWVGPPVPVATCLDCGLPSVVVEGDSSCTRCMGTLEPDDGTLDARFVGAVWGLASAGWPDERGDVRDAAGCTTLLVTPSGLAGWALPMAALAAWLTGHLPFSRVVVHEPAAADVAPADPGVARVALLRGDGDVDRAAHLAAAFVDPPEGDGEIDRVVEPYESAFAAGAPTAALDALASLVDEGVPPSAADRVRALAAPFLGE